MHEELVFAAGVRLAVDWYDQDRAWGRVRGVLYCRSEDAPDAIRLAAGMGVPVHLESGASDAGALASLGEASADAV
ncbi:MAG: hypothetical protein ACM3ML_07420 [Micromonosporaceae bacterium]